MPRTQAKAGAPHHTEIKPDEFEMSRRLEAVRSYVKENMVDRPYHNSYDHVEDMIGAIERIAYFEGIGPYYKFLLKTAGYLHDLICVPFATDNEEKTAEASASILLKLGYSKWEIGIVQSLIISTKVPTAPKTRLEEVICDADTDNLGREDFLDKNIALRVELNAEDVLKWLKGTMDFMRSHRYYTNTAKGIRDFGKKQNMEILQRLIDGMQIVSPFAEVKRGEDT